MSDTKRILTNTAWLSTAEIVNVVLGLLSGIVIVRYLGDTRYGQLGFVQAYTSLFSIFMDFGWSSLMINEVSRDRNLLPKFLNNLVSVKLLLSTISIGIMLIIVFATNKPPEIKLFIFLLAIGMLISSIVGPISSVFRIFQEMRYEAILRIISIALSFCAALIVIWLHLSLLALILSSLIVTAVMAVPTLSFIRKRYLKFKVQFDWDFIKKTLGKAFPLGISAVFVSIYYYLDTVILSFTKTDQEVGWYTAAYRLLLMLLTFIGLYFAALFPELSRIISTDLERARLLSRISLRALSILTLPIAIGSIFVGREFLGLMFGANFRSGGTALALLIWSLPIISISSIYGNLLLAKAERKTQMLGVGIGAAFNVALNFLLIPKFSLIGAAIATLTAEIFVLIFFYWQTKKKVTYVPFLRTITKPLIASALMGVVLMILPQSHVLLTICAGALSYALLLYILKGITLNDARLVFNLVRKRA